MTPKSRERAADLVTHTAVEVKTCKDPDHLAILVLLENTQDHFAKCLDDTESVVALHVEDIKALIGHCMALAKRVSALEEKLGIVEQAVVPGD